MLLFDWKVCRVCGEELPTTHFSLTHSRKGQYRGTCKQCERDKLKRTDAYDKCECGAAKKAESERCITCKNRLNTYDPEFVKHCRRCQKNKKAKEFGWRMSKGTKRVRNICKACARKERRVIDAAMTPEERRQRKANCASRSRKRYLADPVYRLKRQRAAIRVSCKVLGFPELADELAARYDDSTICEICKTRPETKRLHIDHCHKSGKFRGFLCSACNTGIGQLGDSVDRLKAAIAYIQKHGGSACQFEEHS